MAEPQIMIWGGMRFAPVLGVGLALLGCLPVQPQEPAVAPVLILSRRYTLKEPFTDLAARLADEAPRLGASVKSQSAEQVDLIVQMDAQRGARITLRPTASGEAARLHAVVLDTAGGPVLATVMRIRAFVRRASESAAEAPVEVPAPDPDATAPTELPLPPPPPPPPPAFNQ
jgi:hypothetical protein